LIVLSDFDPEGERIPHTAGTTLRDNFHVPPEKLSIIKAGVTRRQIKQHGLPQQNFAKDESNLKEWFVKRNGGDESVYELEALDPGIMLADLEATLQRVLDMKLFKAEQKIERKEKFGLRGARTVVRKALAGMFG
jgi:hypothetical protein